MTQEPIFDSYDFGDDQRARLDRDGHLLLPGLLRLDTRELLTTALAHVQSLMPAVDQNYKPTHFAAEFDSYLASLIAHPQVLELIRHVLGEEIRFDHCVTLNRPGGNPGTHWHSHEYADDNPNLGYLRMFFYVNGFTAGDGGLKVVSGSHLFRDSNFRADTDDELRTGWMIGKIHPVTGVPLEIEEPSAPAGTVALMWTHAAHAVSPRQPGRDTRWTVVYGYRNPGAMPEERWITPAFEQKMIPEAERLMRLD